MKYILVEFCVFLSCVYASAMTCLVTTSCGTTDRHKIVAESTTSFANKRFIADDLSRYVEHYGAPSVTIASNAR